MQNLNEALREIATRYPFTHEKYPELATSNEVQQKDFSIKHGILHVTKSLGILAAVLENSDHGNSTNHQLFQRALVKMLIDVLRLAEIENLDETQIYSQIAKLIQF